MPARGTQALWGPWLITAGLLAAAVFVAAAALVARSDHSTKRGDAAPLSVPDRFDEHRAFRFLRWQVRLGPRPAGSAAARRLAAKLRATVPAGRYEPVPGGLRNVIGTLPGRDPGHIVVVGAHYDTKNLPGFVGANDGASGTAVVLQLARTFRPRTLRPTLVFAFFDGEESPFGTPDDQFARTGLRGSRVASRSLRYADAMVLVDLVGDGDLSLPREAGSSRRLWARLRTAAGRAGTARFFPPASQQEILDDHLPFRRAGVPAIDLIDFDFSCFHEACDDLSAVSPRSLDVVGETLVAFLSKL